MNPELPADQKVWKKNWVQNLGLILVGALLVYGMIYRDVVSRAREAYGQAETYINWHENPAKKKEFFESKFEHDKSLIESEYKQKKMTAEEFQRKTDTLEFDKNFQLQESSLKYAYQWYKDTYELFSPPESKWVKMAREKAPRVLELWKQELREKKIPFENYMLE